MRNNVSNYDYQAIHKWMRATHGNASLCENTNCENKSKHFEWALKKGLMYGKDKRRFLQLCKPCHVRYDMTDEWRAKIAVAGQKRKRPDVSLSMKGNQHARKIPAIIECGWCALPMKPKDRDTRFCSKSCVMKARNDAARKYLETL